jgi:glycosyltransferase involved in cell wall biosynthesis
VLVNGGNCVCAAINWVHYVHAAYQPEMPVKQALQRKRFLRNERKALAQAKLIVTNSRRTSKDIAANIPVDPERLRTIYYGVDAERFRPPTEPQKASARQWLGVKPERPLILFTGAMGDERKGFATLFQAWESLCADPTWDADLAVAGATGAQPQWEARASSAGVLSRIHFLGFRPDMPRVLAAADALVSPTRYEAYGLAVHEALCAGVPSFVTSSAGVAERYPSGLEHLLLRDPNDTEELCNRLRHWRSRMEFYRAEACRFSAELRSRTWDRACSEMVDVIESVE